MEAKETKSCCPPGKSCGSSSVPTNSEAYCKCGPGWSCEIRKIEDPKADLKPFCNCTGEGCICILDDNLKQGEGSREKQVVETGGVFCYCGKGYTCTITKTEGPDAGKVFIECGNGCTCEIPACAPETLVVKDS